jgi:hypothetical protein
MTPSERVCVHELHGPNRGISTIEIPSYIYVNNTREQSNGGLSTVPRWRSRLCRDKTLT